MNLDMAFRSTKRKWVSHQRNISKRRRFTRRRFTRKRKSARQDFTSLQTAPRSRIIRRRRFNRRKYKRTLFLLTDVLSKYKSAGAATGTLSSPALATSCSVFLGNFMPYGTGAYFWTAAGGANSLTFGGTVPIFTTNTMVIRGGKYYITVCNPSSATESAKVRIQLLFAKQQRQQASNPALATGVPLSDWITSLPGSLIANQGIQVIGDYDEYFYQPIVDKECILQVGESVQVERNMGCHRIDVDQWARGAGWFPYFVVYNQNVSGGVDTLQVTRTWDLTFSALPT